MNYNVFIFFDEILSVNDYVNPYVVNVERKNMESEIQWGWGVSLPPLALVHILTFDRHGNTDSQNLSLVFNNFDSKTSSSRTAVLFKRTKKSLCMFMC